jgi:carboxyl-terminal processing protease
MRAFAGRALLSILICGWLTVIGAGAADAEPRVALVIGNSDYGGDLGHLPNPVNDAKLMAETLRKVGFDVVEVEDGDQAALKQAIVDFGDKLSGAGAGATGLFFYAGHGVQMGGDNYLIPVRAKLRKPADLDVEAVPISLVLKQMDFAQSAVNIVILDACRNNPLSSGGRGASRGLAEIKSKPVGSFISFSTAPGEVAEDGNGANSPYTAALADAILRPGLDLAEVFRAVRKSVLKETNQKQTPWDSWSLTDPYYFIPPRDTAEAAPSKPSEQFELAFWDSIKNSNNAADFQAYLDQYPAGSFVALANNRLKALSTAKVAESDRTVAPAVGVSFTAVDQIVYARNAGALYAAPDETADLISTAPPQTAVRAAGRSPDGAWWQLHLPNGRTAYAKDADIDTRPAITADASTGHTATPPGEPPVATAPPPAEPEQTAAAQPVDTAAAKQHFDLGQALFNQGDLKGARAEFDQAVAGDPKHAEAFLRRGQVALALADIDAAGADLDQAVALDPNLLEAHGDRILVRLAQGDIAGAAKASDEIQQVDSTVWTVNAVAAFYFAGRLEEALAMAERVTSHEPTYARGWIWQALVLVAQGRDGEAFDLLDTGIGAVGNRNWPVPIMEWMQGKRDSLKLLEAAKAGGDPKIGLRQLAEMSFFLGEATYRQGDRVQAAALLAQSSDAKAPDLLACAAARALLVKMARE